MKADQERRRARLLVTPGLAWITVIYVVPTLLILAYSFLTPRIGGGVEWSPTLDAWRELLSRNVRSVYYNSYLSVTIRSVVWAAVATAISLLAAFPLAVFISQRRSAITRNALLVAVIIPFWTSMLVRTYAVRFLLGNTGPVNGMLERIGLETQVFLNTRFAVVLGLTYTALPFMILPVYAAVERVDGRVIEASRDLGANAIQTFRRVYLPLTRTGVVVGCTMAFVLSVSQFVVPVLLGGNRVTMIANLIALQFGEGFNWPLGSAIAILFTALGLLGLRFIVGRRDDVGGVL